MKDALSYQTQQLLKANKIIIDFNELEFQIQSHPTYPSLHAITGVLDHFNIENLALDVPITANVLRHLPNTFLAQINIEEQKQFAVVSKIKNNYHLIFDSKSKKTVSESDFLNQFTGIVLAVDKTESDLSNNYSNIRSNIIRGLAIGSAIVFVLLFANTNPSIINILFLTTSILGAYISFTILKQEQGESTLLGNAFCSNPTEKKSCNAVLSSKGATVFEGFKLSDMSFIYFTSLGLATFLLVIVNESVFIPKLISALALSITVYSIYYQIRVVKKWCFLCLCIVGLIWLQAGLFAIDNVPNFTLSSILFTTLSFISIGAIWLFMSKIYKDNTVLNRSKVDYFKFKRNFELFNSQLDKSKVIDTKIDNIDEIEYGNPNSNFNITIITNPLCGHCKPVHKLIEQILQQYSQSVKLTIRFNINPKDPESGAVKIATRLLDLYNNSTETCMKAMHEIYGTSTINDWLNKWKLCSDPIQYLSILKNEYDWCTTNGTNFTPEILINGKSYPSIFDRSDLIYFIEDLQSEAKHQVRLPETENI
ncbi:vitamin K epoxide reductase family protein [uncultured Winogradskyella sp.]|uniref:vitamin K epoxide reductase family protein n=1 Tax=uncultured Winogradskyella sp. TaxID=395353 RepID=UPI002612CA24|nr:vitamin K epoxide reductase family protein [uncultured Winogradskyella sp.]